MEGIEIKNRIVKLRGEYYKLKKKREGIVRKMIYNIKDKEMKFIGIKMKRKIDGGVKVGKNEVMGL